MASNTAIFYDIENLLGIFNNRTNTSLHLDEIYRRVLEMDGVTGVSIQRAYADWAVPMCRNLRNSVLQVGIEPIQIFNTNQNDRVKNAADICLIIDAVDLVARRPEIENYVIASGDGIFAFLSKKLHEHGKRVIGCGFEKISNGIFRNSCDAFIALEKSDTSIIVTATTKAAAAKVEAKPEPVKAPAPPKAEAAEKPEKKTTKKKSMPLPKTKYTDALLASNIEVPQDTGDKSGVMHMIHQMVDALFIDETKDLPGLEISIFANYINHYIPGFKVRSVGFRGIGEFMRFMLTGSQYCTYSVADNVVLMAPRATAEATGGKIVADVQGLLIVTPEGERYNSVFNVPEDTPFVYSVQKPEAVKPKEVRPKEAKPKEAKAKEAKTKEAKTKEAKAKVAKPKTPKAAPAAKEKDAAPRPAASQTAAVAAASAGEEGTVRKLVKSEFEDFAANNILPPSEVAQLTAQDYSLKTFGVRAPIFRELEPQRSLREQRLINGKMKYWKEIFVFGGKQYLVYKEWANIHKNRFMAWCAKFKQS